MKIKLTYLFLLTCTLAFGQINLYDYKRELHGIKDQWHKIILPNDMFGKVSSDLSDIRIYGLTEKNDTLEAPYILKLATEKTSLKELAFNLVNESKNDRGYYFTFEVPSENAVNQIQLEFNQQNFDWRLALEGSHDQQEWFSIIDNYRILSIKNDLTDYQFTKVRFPNSRYRYFRLRVDSDKKPKLLSAKMSLNETMEGNFRNYPIHSIKMEEERQNKQTIIHIDLKSTVPVSRLKIKVKNQFDYYRPVSIQYLSDSIKTEQGWKYTYSTLTSGMLNSIEKNEFKFNSTLLRELKVIIENQDNESLEIDSVVVDGYVHELIVRCVAPATYYLTYGNKKAAKPHYDINRFAANIPTVLTPLTLGEEQSIEKKAVKTAAPLFQNKVWLWAIMILIISLLGWFAIRMMRQK